MADGTSVTHKRTTTATIGAADFGNYDELDITIGVVATGNDATVDADTVNSDEVELAAVDGSIRSLEVDRDVDGGVGEGDPVVDEISATWFGPGSPGLTHRIALYVEVEGGSTTENKWEWVVFGTVPSPPTFSRATDIPDDTGSGWGQWSFSAFNLNLDANAGADLCKTMTTQPLPTQSACRN